MQMVLCPCFIKRSKGLLEKDRIHLFRCRFPDSILRSLRDAADGLDRCRHIAAQSFLSSPRRSIGNHTAFLDLKKGFIIIDHHYVMVSEQFTPEAGVGGFAAAAGGRENVCPAVDANGGAVEKNDSLTGEAAHNSALDGTEFQLIE